MNYTDDFINDIILEINKKSIKIDEILYIEKLEIAVKNLY